MTILQKKKMFVVFFVFICNVTFVQHIKAIILLENGGQRRSQEGKKNQGFAKKKILLCGLVRRSLGY
jgi:hypothetical protein